MLPLRILCNHINCIALELMYLILYNCGVAIYNIPT